MRRLLFIVLFTILSLFSARAIVGYIYSYYFEYKNECYYYSGTTHYTSDSAKAANSVKLEKYDRKTFKSLDGTYAIDKKRVFYQGQVLPKVSPKNFRIAERYGINEHKVFYEGKIIESADSKTFEVVAHPLKNRHTLYAKDKNYVYKNNNRIPYDPASFRLIEHTYLLDKNGIYFDNKKVDDANPQNYIFKNQFLISNNRIFLYGEEMPYDVGSFQILDSTVWRNGVGGRGIDGYLVKDKNGVYIEKDTLDIDNKSFEYIGGGLFKDKNSVYFKSNYSGSKLKWSELDLDAQDTQYRKLVIYDDNNRQETLYIVGDKRNVYSSFEKRPRRHDFVIDWDTFEPYMKTKTCSYYRDKNRFYMYKRYESDFNFIYYLGPKSQLIYFDEDKILMKDDDTIYQISARGNISICEERDRVEESRTISPKEWDRKRKKTLE